MSQQLAEEDEMAIEERSEILESKVETYKQGLEGAWDTIDDLEEEELRKNN